VGGGDSWIWDYERLGLVELWKVTAVRSAVLGVDVKEIGGSVGLPFRVETSTAEVEETNEHNGYEGYYAADHAADDCARIRFPADKQC
jgi:hypothetical protein